MSISAKNEIVIYLFRNTMPMPCDSENVNETRWITILVTGSEGRPEVTSVWPRAFALTDDKLVEGLPAIAAPSDYLREWSYCVNR